MSIPSLGTGIETAHEYLRFNMGLVCILVFVFYEKEFWSNKLLTMIAGISPEAAPHFFLKEYEDFDDGKKILDEFLCNLR